jgi:RimJ/RimL family protein N-acetyltransferase
MATAPAIIETERLRLRRPRSSDAEAIFEYGCDLEVTRYMDWPTHRSIDAVVEYLGGCVPRWESGVEYYWVITSPPEDRAIGGISCRVSGQAAEFGYVLNRSCWNRGYASEAAHAVVDFVLSQPEIHRVWATCDTENLASVRVLEKCGLSREGILRCWAIRPNISQTPRDAFMYSKISMRS